VKCNFGISKTTLSRHFMKFQEKEIPTYFQYTAKIDVEEIFGATQEVQLFEYFRHAVKFILWSNKKEAQKIAYHSDKENRVAMPDSWVKNKCVRNTWLRGLRKNHESLCFRKPEATILTRLNDLTLEM